MVRKKNPEISFLGSTSSFQSVQCLTNRRYQYVRRWDIVKYIAVQTIFIISCRITFRLNLMHDQGSPPCSICECICVCNRAYHLPSVMQCSIARQWSETQVYICTVWNIPGYRSITHILIEYVSLRHFDLKMFYTFLLAMLAAWLCLLTFNLRAHSQEFSIFNLLWHSTICSHVHEVLIKFCKFNYILYIYIYVWWQLYEEKHRLHFAFMAVCLCRHMSLST